MLDALAREVGTRAARAAAAGTWCGPSRCRSTTSPSKHFDCGDYPEALRRARGRDRLSPGVRARQQRGEPDGRRDRRRLCDLLRAGRARHHRLCRLGHPVGARPRAGVRALHARRRAGAAGRRPVHGQGLETTLAQVAHAILGIASSASRVVHGDTAMTPYSTGTWGSRCMVMAGGAVAAACDELAERVRGSAPSCCRPIPRTVGLEDGEVVGPSGGSRRSREVARTWYRRPQDLPPDVDPGGLEVTAGYKTKRDTGTFSYAAHAAVVAVDPETGDVEILDYVVVEDGGVARQSDDRRRPDLSAAWRRASAPRSTRRCRSTRTGQPLASTLADYLLPGPTEVPAPASSTWRRLALHASSARRASAKAAPSRRRPPSPTRSTTRSRPRRRDQPVADHAAPHPRGHSRLRWRAQGDSRRGGVMKAVAFDYERPSDIKGALALLGDDRLVVKLLAGGQSLGPMLNLRLVRPS